MRAYRPGLMGGEDYEEEAQHHREKAVQVYSKRAQAGLPLFEPMVTIQSAKASAVSTLRASSR